MIAPTAQIHPSAKIGKNVHVGHFSVIGEHVEIGDDCWIGPHAVINGPTKLGKKNKIFQFASIGEAPQDKKYEGEPTRLEVGDGNTFRECTTISRGTTSGGGLTKIGNDNLFMAYVHIAHDCIVHNYTTFSNNASLAGHVEVQDHANLGGFAGVHQFCKIGAYAFCAGASVIVKDVLPYLTVSGHPAQTYGLNLVGLKRQGFTPEELTLLKRVYRIIFREGHTLEEAVHQVEGLMSQTDKIAIMLDMIKSTERGFTR